MSLSVTLQSCMCKIDKQCNYNCNPQTVWVLKENTVKLEQAYTHTYTYTDAHTHTKGVAYQR